MENYALYQTTIYSKSFLVSGNSLEPSYKYDIYKQMIVSLIYLVTYTSPYFPFYVFFLLPFSFHMLRDHCIVITRIFCDLAGTIFLFPKYYQFASSVPLESYGLLNTN